MKRSILGVLLLTVAVIVANPALGAVWYVDDGIATSGDGPPAIVFAHRPLLDGNREFEPFRQAAPLLELLESSAVLMYMNGDFHESAEVALNGVHHIWCDNLSFIHTGEETYNLYEIGPDSVRIYHVHLEGTREFVLEFSRL